MGSGAPFSLSMEGVADRKVGTVVGSAASTWQIQNIVWEGWIFEILPTEIQSCGHTDYLRLRCVAAAESTHFRGASSRRSPTTKIMAAKAHEAAIHAGLRQNMPQQHGANIGESGVGGSPPKSLKMNYTDVLVQCHLSLQMADQNRTAGARLQTSPSLEPVVSSVDFERATQQQQPMQHLNRGMILDRLAQLSKENSTQLTPLKAEPGTQLAGTPFYQSNSVAPQPIASQIYRPQFFILPPAPVPSNLDQTCGFDTLRQLAWLFQLKSQHTMPDMKSPAISLPGMGLGGGPAPPDFHANAKGPAPTLRAFPSPAAC
jgi:hypothetical protein